MSQKNIAFFSFDLQSSKKQQDSNQDATLQFIFCFRHLIEVFDELIRVGGPPHDLKIKKNFCVILLRKLSSCGKRYVSLETGTNVVFIPRIVLTPSDIVYLCTMRRKPFPLIPAFRMTANTPQVQTLRKVGVYFRQQMFSTLTVCLYWAAWMS